MNKSLNEYNKKRNFDKTNEPIGKTAKSKKRLCFCVQHHMSRKEHYDFRLEWNGVLKSFAIPKGPSYNPKDKRLAVQVEDHPLTYRNFEGIIPKGEYGGGTVMLFDEGYWEPLDDFNGNFNNETIKLELKGKRLKGKWTLTYFKNNNWLLIKEDDGIHLYSDILEFNKSIKSNKLMEEITNNKKIIKNSKINDIVEYVKISNPLKIIFKKPKTTKLDIVRYYQAAAKRMLPLVRGRILSVVRCPDGVFEKSFFKKHLENEDKGIGMITIPSTNDKKNDYYYIRDTSGLIKEVQMNSIEFHIWGSFVDDIDYPNMLVFDFDPDENISLTKIREGVKDLKSILDEFSLKSFLKTSGGKGYHVVVPIKKLKNWKKFHDVAEKIAKLMVAKWPDKYVATMNKNKRKGKIFIDWFRNTKGATSVAPYSIRAREKLAISMPISWNELDKVKPNEITIKEALKRLKRKDPWFDFFDCKQ